MQRFNQYINEIAKVKDELEHSGRTPLQILLQDFANEYKIEVIHERKRDKKGRGAPDYYFHLNNTDIGYLENKKIGENLDEVLKSDQIRKYKTLTDNLILTDYLRWIWIYKDEVIKDVRLCERTVLEQKSIKLSEENCKKVEDLINDFLSQKPQEITKANELAKILAKPTRTIKEEIELETKEQIAGSTYSELKGLLDVFKDNISQGITPEEFSDAFAQTLTYSLFLTKLNLVDQSEKLTLGNIGNYTPQSFALIKDILIFVQKLDKYPNLKPYIERILHIINHINSFELASDLQFIQGEEKDPYIYFYEDFLKAYDPQIRVDAGVYYTPEPVVRSIVQNIHSILQNEFELKDGLANESVKVLDFACGTGTFLFQIYEQILAEVPETSLKRKGLIKNHLLKNIYGFELLIPAYCVSHLKLSQYLKEKAHYSLAGEERVQVYLTNTLENRENQEQHAMEWFIPAIANEGRTAQKIKDDNEILVITGNPPYNGNSQNNFKYIQDLIKPYFPNDEITERNPKWLNDDYVKFIRFAENKIAKAGKGVFGVITSHSFIDNPTFRAMRKHLMDTFDKIYIIDLHGNAKKKEKSPDGSQDQNVFDIQQGVAISFFVKNPAIKAEEKGIYHLDIFGKRDQKFAQISQIDLQKSAFTQLQPSAPFYLFIPQNANTRVEYEKGVSLREVFGESGVGICSKKDEIVFQNSKEQLLKVLQDFERLDIGKIKEKYKITKESEGWKVEWAKANIKEYGIKDEYIKECNYRPFDKKYTYHTDYNMGFIARPVYKNMSHLLHHKNVGLVFIRQTQALGEEDADNLCFVSDRIIDLNLYRRGGACIAPLYLYNPTANGEVEKTVNFKPEFAKMVAKRFAAEPEEVLAYIYAVLHSPTYRTKFLEFLKIDFPRIPFDVLPEEFHRLAKLGQELMDAHLMKVIPQSKIGEPEADGVDNYVMEKVAYNEEKQRLYFNKTCFFADVSPAVWSFKIGGYQVLDKYLKARKGVDISEDLEHVQNVIKVLAFTIEKMGEIEVVETV